MRWCHEDTVGFKVISRLMRVKRPGGSSTELGKNWLLMLHTAFTGRNQEAWFH